MVEDIISLPEHEVPVPSISKEQAVYYARRISREELLINTLLYLFKVEGYGEYVSKVDISKQFSIGQVTVERIVSFLDGMTLLDIRKHGMLYMMRLNENGRVVFQILYDNKIVKL